MELNDAIRFYGSEKVVLPGAITSLCNHFTYEFWIKAELPIQLHPETNEGIYGTEGQRYLIGPGYRIYANEASIGISAGTNGISIYEHADHHMPAVLVHEVPLTEWTHIAIVYDDRTPFLYVNGVLVKQGCKSERAFLYASDLIGGHQYGYYMGDIKELRIWQQARSAEQLQSLMHMKLNSVEDGLYYYDNAEQGYVVCNGVSSSILMSIIIPSHNRFPLNSLTLHSLSLQTFPAEHMEVIVIDDASTDSTPDMLEHFHSPFMLKRIRTESNLGRSIVRNIGIRMSVGRRILFMDAEMLGHPQLVETHYGHHLEDEGRIVSASMRLKRLYTVLFSNYSKEQVLHLRSLYRDDHRARRIIHYFIHHHRITQQLFPTDYIQNTNWMERRSYLYDHYGDVLQTYGNELTGFLMPWINFITSNVSVSRYALFEAGLFDEQFSGYGWEDWELGFRLYTRGATFIHDPNATAYHQEHPISSANRAQSQANFIRFYKKHAELAVLLLTLTIIPPHLSYCELNNYLAEFNHLQANEAHRYPRFMTSLLQLLNNLADQFTQEITLQVHQEPWNHELALELEELRRLEQYPQLIELYDRLTSMITGS